MQASIFNEYLKSEHDDWSICLEKSFAVLRTSWEGEWVGLPYLLSRCVDFLNLSATTLSSDASQMLLTAKAIAERIEFQYSQSLVEAEPKYHCPSSNGLRQVGKFHCSILLGWKICISRT